MRDSKAIKSSARWRWNKSTFKTKLREIPKIGYYLAEAYEYLKIDIYYGTLSFFSRTRERILRSIDWARFGYMNHDFDSAFLFDVMEFKLKRIHKCLKEGIAVQHKEDMLALKEAIVLCKRLREQNYEDKYYKAHEKKWGRSKYKSVPAEVDKDGHVLTYKLNITKKKVRTKKQKAQERKEFMKNWEYAEKDRVADHDRLNEIFKKHERRWWD